MNKFCEFIGSAYVETARARSYDDSVKIICELLSRHIEAAVLVFREYGTPGVMAAACHVSLKQLDKRLRDEVTASGIAAGVASVSQVSLNITLSGMTEAGLVVPIVAKSERLGTLAVFRELEFSPEELIIGEAAAIVLAANMKAIKNEHEASAIKDVAAVRSALGTLSYSELEASMEVFRRLAGDEGSIIAARVAGESNATRSAIVNALRKLESAGLLESHSMGVKGTYIKIRTPVLREELRKFGN